MIASAAWVVVLAALAPAPAGPPPPSAQPSPIKGADLALLDEIRLVAKRVEQLRGQPFERPPLAVRAADSMREVAAEIRAYNVLPRERLAARGRAWADLGLGDAGTPRRLLVALAADLAGIGFDAQGNRLLVAPDRLTPHDFQSSAGDPGPSTILAMTGVRQDEPSVAHVLVHVRQRERAGGDPLHVEQTDRLLATAAWVEGEANLLAVRHLFGGLGVADDVVQAGLGPEHVLEGRLLPPGFADLPGPEGDLVRFVYLEGFAQCALRHRSGGWPAVDQAFERRRTTRDLLHPEREPARTAAFPEPAAPRPGLRLADDDVLGEQAIVVLVSRTTGKDNLGLIAGDGWAGDRVLRWEDPTTKAGVTEWITRWADAAAAEEFDYAVGRALTARYPERALEGPKTGPRTLRGPDGREFRLERRDAEVRLAVAQAPAPKPAPARPAGAGS